MRIKDYRRFIIHAQRLVRKAAELRVIDFTGSLYEVDFKCRDPMLLYDRLEFHSGLVQQVAILSLKDGHLELAEEATTLYRGLNKGGIKRA